MRRLRRVIWRTVLALAGRVGVEFRTVLWVEGDTLRHRGFRWTARWNAMLGTAYVQERRRRSSYRWVGEQELRALRRSDTVVVFGSGYSLNEIGPDEWKTLAAHDVIGFNGFFRERWITVDFHIFRGALYGELRWRPYAEQVRDGLARNTLYADTTYVLQGGFLAQHGNQLIACGVIPAGARVARYRTLRGPGLPSRSFEQGLRHVMGTLNDAVNLAFCLGWKEIVLAGVDLYDSRYFWLPPNETIAIDPDSARLVGSTNSIAGQRFDARHNTATNGIVECIAEWWKFLADEGVSLTVHNPRSLLAKVIPVYVPPAIIPPRQDHRSRAGSERP